VEKITYYTGVIYSSSVESAGKHGPLLIASVTLEGSRQEALCCAGPSYDCVERMSSFYDCRLCFFSE